MDVTVRVLCQYINENGKKKGGMEIEFPMDDYDAMYCSNMEEVCSEVARITSKEWAGEFVYISHELIFHNPIKVDKDIVEKVIMKVGQ